MTPREIAARLALDVEGVCRMLLPGGKRAGAEWEVGSVDGESGRSLRVHLTGPKAGIWADFADGAQRGDLVDLWAAVRGVSLAEALRQASDHLGIRPERFHGRRPRQYRQPEKPECRTPQSRVRDYLRSRGLTDETIRAYRVGEAKDGEVIVFPYLRDSKLVSAKYLRVDRPGGKKVEWVERDAEPCLFGWQAIAENARSVTLCEGEIDAMTCWQMGLPALSIPFGAGSTAWIEHEFDGLERFDEIYLAFDQDAAGERGLHAHVERLGRERCRVVRLIEKDANAMLATGLDRDTFHDLWAAARTLDPAELRSAADYVNDVVHLLYPPEGAEESRALVLPFEKLVGKVRFQHGEYVLWNGINGHGKSQLVGHAILEAMKLGYRVCVASLEMKPARWLARMDRQACAVREPAIPFLRAVHDWYADRLWVFDLVGTAKVDRLLEVFAYARRRYGIDVFVIDSLLKCGLAETDYDGQKLFVERLCDFKNAHDCIVWLVAHTRKQEDEGRVTGKMDVRGAGAITDLADTVLTVWRNKAKEEYSEKHADKPDALLICSKNRNGEWEGRQALWFDRDTFQFLDRDSVRPKRYVEFMRPIEEVA